VKRTTILVLLILAISAPAFCEGINIAPRCRVLVSGTPNPAWEGKNIVDDDIGPSRGWIARVDPKEPPWVRFVLPYPVEVTRLRIMPASYTEVERRRFSRPKKVSVLLKGDVNKALEFTLEDKEDGFQNLPIGVDGVYEISIIIDEVYPNARIPEMVGFQEVLIEVPQQTTVTSPGESGKPVYAEKVRNPVEEARELLEKDKTLKKEVSGKASNETKDEDPRKGTLSPEERQILDSLKQLIQRLEQKFMED